MNPEQQKSILAIARHAAFADGAKDDREREEIRRIAVSLGNEAGVPDLARLYQDVLLKRVTLEAAVSAEQSAEALVNAVKIQILPHQILTRAALENVMMAAGGSIALVQDGDSITIVADARLFLLNVPDEEFAHRRQAWQLPAPCYTRYIGEVRQASVIGKPGSSDGFKPVIFPYTI